MDPESFAPSQLAQPAHTSTVPTAAPPPRHTGKHKRRFHGPVAIALQVCLLGMAVGAGWTFRHEIKRAVVHWRVERLRAEAVQLAASDDVIKALRRAKAACNLDPWQIQSSQVYFDLAARSNSPLIEEAASLLFSHPESTGEQKKAVLSALLKAGHHRTFANLFDRLGEQRNTNVDYQLLAVDYLSRVGNVQKARLFAEEAAKQFEDPRAKRVLAELVLTPACSAADLERACEILVELIAKAPGEARELFRMLWNVPVERLTQARLSPRITAWAAGLPGPHPREHLLLTMLRMAESPTSSEALVKDAVAQHKTKSPEALCDWLARLGRLDLTAGFLDEKLGMQSPVLYLHRLRSLLATRGPEAVEAWLEKPHPHASKMELSLWRARLALVRKDRLTFLANWENAFQQTSLEGGTQNKFPMLYAIALQAGDLNLAARALGESARHPRNFLPDGAGLLGVLTFLRNEGRLQELELITAGLLESGFANPVLQNNYAYLTLLFSTHRDPAIQIVRPLVESFPRVAAFRTTLAYAQLLEGDVEQAWETLRAPAVQWEQATDADWAIQALVLEHRGELDRAQRIRKDKVDTSRLSAVERRLLAPYVPPQAVKPARLGVQAPAVHPPARNPPR